MHRSKEHPHSITSSARPSKVGGTSRSLAVSARTASLRSISIGVGALNSPVQRNAAGIPGLQDLQAVEQPGRYRAAVEVAPEDVALAVRIEVAGLDDVPVGRHSRVATTLRHADAVHQPHRDRTGVVVAPENVALAVTVEVAGADNDPIGGDGAGASALLEGEAIHQPDPDRAAGAVVPENVRHAVAVEVARADDLPVVSDCAVAAGLQRLDSVHQPARHRAAVAVAPSDVALAVAVEVVGICGRQLSPDLAARVRCIVDVYISLAGFEGGDECGLSRINSAAVSGNKGSVIGTSHAEVERIDIVTAGRGWEAGEWHSDDGGNSGRSATMDVSGAGRAANQT